MGTDKERYGIPGAEVANLRKRWRKLGDSRFESFDAFLRWASENGYQKGLALRRYDQRAPHGPGNSFYCRMGAWDKTEKQKKQKGPPVEFCRDCKKKCPSGGKGCGEWRKWVVKNWDENIHVPKEPDDPEPVRGRQFFRYPHPDLAREGIE